MNFPAYPFRVCVLFSLIALTVTAFSHLAAAQKFEGQCSGGTQWHGSPGWAALSFCEEEPAHIVSLSCTKDSRDIAVAFDFSAARGKQPKGPIAVKLTIDGQTRTIPGTPNYNTMYERLEYTASPSDPVLEMLHSGRDGSIVILDQTTPIHLKGSGRAIDVMMKGCGE